MGCDRKSCGDQQSSTALQTPNRYRHTLEKLTGEPPATKTALISILLPEIESALASGKTRRQIWQRLVEDGFDLSYDTLRHLSQHALAGTKKTPHNRRHKAKNSQSQGGGRGANRGDGARSTRQSAKTGTVQARFSLSRHGKLRCPRSWKEGIS
jgi:hypothetical protein